MSYPVKSSGFDSTANRQDSDISHPLVSLVNEDECPQSDDVIVDCILVFNSKEHLEVSERKM